MKKKSIIIATVIFTLFLHNCVDFLDDLEFKAEFKRTLEEIKSDFKGVIVEEFSTHENLEPMWLKIKTKKDTIEISNSKITEYAIVGDSLIKTKNENLVYVIKQNGDKKEFYFTLISKRVREHVNFPKEWKDKWLESTVN